MAGNPWSFEQLATQKRLATQQRAACLQSAARHAATDRRIGRPGRPRIRPFVARRVGRLLVAAGYRLGGTDALSPLPRTAALRR